ncbi:calcium-binding EGF-like domain-containing protein [Rurimicrobium arvi]|uniref:EGF-like domain-containing protein n=1 Tax=Rurimicrobium arvi TaxID=2049916 RepID=A0ABP8MTX9_9BACT
MKKSVKLVLLSALGAASIFSTISLTSCKRDKCKTISCQNGSKCIESEGSCECAPGYEGSMCEVVTRDKFTGTWNVQEQGTISPTTQYVASIKNSALPGANNADVQVFNLNNSTFGLVNAVVKGDTITIPEQNIDNKKVQGIGYLTKETFYGNHETLILKYKITNMNNGDVDDFGFVVGTPSTWYR